MNAKQLRAMEERTRSRDPCPLCRRGSGDGTMVNSVFLIGVGALSVGALWLATAAL